MRDDIDYVASAYEAMSYLCLEAGRVMEDESLTCALVLPKDNSELEGRLKRIIEAGADIAGLAAATQILYRRSQRN